MKSKLRIVSGVVLGIILVGGLITIGWLGNNLYHDYKNKRYTSGLWLSGIKTKVDALKITKEYDSVGSWVCVNIKGMNLDEIVKTCQHEAGHEMFARYCERNWEKCSNLTK